MRGEGKKREEEGGRGGEEKGSRREGEKERVNRGRVSAASGCLLSIVVSAYAS